MEMRNQVDWPWPSRRVEKTVEGKHNDDAERAEMKSRLSVDERENLLRDKKLQTF